MREKGGAKNVKLTVWQVKQDGLTITVGNETAEEKPQHQYPVGTVAQLLKGAFDQLDINVSSLCVEFALRATGRR